MKKRRVEYMSSKIKTARVLNEEEVYEIMDAFEPGMDDPIARKLDDSWDELDTLLDEA